MFKMLAILIIIFIIFTLCILIGVLLFGTLAYFFGLEKSWKVAIKKSFKRFGW